MAISFSVDKLNDKDKAFYTSLSKKDKARYERSWLKVEEQKEKAKQAKARLDKMKSAVKIKERKARTRHLIEVGGIVEKYVSIYDLEKFEGYIKQWSGAIKKTQPEAPAGDPEEVITDETEKLHFPESAPASPEEKKEEEEKTAPKSWI